MPAPSPEYRRADGGMNFLAELPLIPPREAFALLEVQGYRGQAAARRSLALAAYRHVRRLKRIYLDGAPRETVPAKANYLLAGPTGCGKTFLVELMFGHILKLPTVIVDMTGFSETGYIGDDTRTILTRLLLAADGNPLVASAGVVCMDEFDKLATTQNVGRFDGAGTTKDVSGFGVQRELLRMMEGGGVEVPTDFNNSIYSTKQAMQTGDITFIACGAFTGLKLEAASAAGEYGGGALGFNARTGEVDRGEAIAVTLEQDEVNDVENFQRFGFLPELIGRFTRIVPLAPLSSETLKQILQGNVVDRYIAEFASEGLTLEIDEPVLDHIVAQSRARQTGARGLNSLLTQYIEDAAFEHFCERSGRVRLTLDGESVVAHYTS